VAAAIDRADLLCLPSLWPENAPLVLLEARARGRAVLASDLGGVAESACGRLLTAGDVEEWRGAIEGLARDRRALARQTAEVRPPRTLVSVVEDHRELYSATLEHP
jgi:glycosyltransferase involved in cell wall biosynthesis